MSFLSRIEAATRSWGKDKRKNTSVFKARKPDKAKKKRANLKPNQPVKPVKPVKPDDHLVKLRQQEARAQEEQTPDVTVTFMWMKRLGPEVIDELKRIEATDYNDPAWREFFHTYAPKIVATLLRDLKKVVPIKEQVKLIKAFRKRVK